MEMSAEQRIARQIVGNSQLIYLLADPNFLKGKELIVRSAQILQRFWRRCFRQYVRITAALLRPLSDHSKKLGLHLGYPLLISVQTELEEDALVRRCNRKHWDRDSRAPRKYYFTVKIFETGLYHKLFQGNLESFFWETPSDEIRLVNCIRDDVYGSDDIVSDYLSLPTTLTDLSRESELLLDEFNGWLVDNEHDIQRYKVETMIPFHFNPVIDTLIISFLLPKIA